MPKFMLTYLGAPKPKTPEDAQQMQNAYQAWLSELGPAAISPMNPLKATEVIRSDLQIESGSATGMSGFTLLEAGSLEAAREIAKACPFLSAGGELELSEIVDMSR